VTRFPLQRTQRRRNCKTIVVVASPSAIAPSFSSIVAVIVVLFFVFLQSSPDLPHFGSFWR
jgi:hypothetical protein